MSFSPDHRISHLASYMLTRFVWPRPPQPPYELPIPEWLQQESGWPRDRAMVLPARPKVGWATSPHSLMVHSIRDAAVASFFDGQRLWYAAQWKCLLGGVNVIFCASPDATGSMCVKCSAADLAGPGVYRLYDDAGSLLYLGSSMHPHLRIMDHHSKPWWPQVARAEVTECGNVFAARAAETRALATEQSVYNRRRCA